jgi:hypothetical protein
MIDSINAKNSCVNGLKQIGFIKRAIKKYYKINFTFFLFREKLCRTEINPSIRDFVAIFCIKSPYVKTYQRKSYGKKLVLKKVQLLDSA